MIRKTFRITKQNVIIASKLPIIDPNTPLFAIIRSQQDDWEWVSGIFTSKEDAFQAIYPKMVFSLEEYTLLLPIKPIDPSYDCRIMEYYRDNEEKLIANYPSRYDVPCDKAGIFELQVHCQIQKGIIFVVYNHDLYAWIQEIHGNLTCARKIANKYDHNGIIEKRILNVDNMLEE